MRLPASLEKISSEKSNQGDRRGGRTKPSRNRFRQKMNNGHVSDEKPRADEVHYEAVGGKIKLRYLKIRLRGHGGSN